MHNNQSSLRNPQIDLDNIDTEIDCIYCGREAKPYAYSKYSINSEIIDQDIYICDDCPSIFVIEDDHEGNVSRYELSKGYLRLEDDIPF